MPRASDITLKSTAIDLVTIVLSLTITYFLLHTVTPNRRGFFCDDKTLSYPYRKNTISVKQCYYGAIISGILVVLVREAWMEPARAPEAEGRRGPRDWGRVRSWAVRAGRQAMFFSFGMDVMAQIGNLGKVTVGRLRPHFFHVCPAALELCSKAQKLGTDLPVFIANFTCEGEGTDLIKKVSMSFPSLHSAVAFYTAVFIVLFLERGIRWSLRGVVAKTMFEALVVAVAWFTALSRVTDHRHHASDVLAGIVLGTVFAWFWVRHVCMLQRQKNVPKRQPLHRSSPQRNVQIDENPSQCRRRSASRALTPLHANDH